MFDDLDESRVRFCHWKSNEHLDSALEGLTDLDLLVAAEDAGIFGLIAARHRFIPVRNTRMRRIRDLEDHLGMDQATGTIVHLHVHYQLVLGERNVKDHHLPVEEWLLSNPIRRLGVPVPAPESELILLYVRSVLKVDALGVLAGAVAGRRYAMPNSIRAELYDLLAQTSADDVVGAIKRSGLPLDQSELREFLYRAQDDDWSVTYLLACKKDMRRRLRGYERHGRLAGSVRRVVYRFRFDARIQRRWPVRRKSLVKRGVYVAVVGADGSGKSSLVADLSRWLEAKLATSTFYFGQPKHDRMLIALRRASRFAERGKVSDALQGAAWCYVARLRRRTDRCARRRRDRGQIVIAERYPLPEFGHMAVPMDGPRLSGRVADGWLVRSLARYEARCYAGICRPDVILALNATLPTLRARKPATDPAEHAAKASAVSELATARPIVRIDAERPYPEVVLAARRQIWAAVLQSQGSQ